MAVFLAVSAWAQSVWAQDGSRYAGMDKDEAGLWFIMDEAEKKVKTSGARITDPALNTYITDLTCRIVGPDCENLRVYLVNSPEFNASMAPNGMMIVNSGLMLRVENEAQLGCVIGHEYGHFTEGHSLSQWRGIKNAANASLFIPLAGALIGIAAVQDFSRDQERDSDQIGFKKVAEYGYKSSECAAVWRNLIAEQSKSVVKKRRKNATKTSNGVFSSHPVPKERVETLDRLATEFPGGELTGVDVYRQNTSGFLAKWLKYELLAKDYERHIHLFETLKAQGHSEGVVNYYLGESYRLRRDEGDVEKAVSHWKQAAQSHDAPPETWRALAEHYRKTKDKAQAKEHYKTYLLKAPNAPDKSLIAKYIERLEREN